MSQPYTLLMPEKFKVFVNRDEERLSIGALEEQTEKSKLLRRMKNGEIERA